MRESCSTWSCSRNMELPRWLSRVECLEPTRVSVRTLSTTSTLRTAAASPLGGRRRRRRRRRHACGRDEEQYKVVALPVSVNAVSWWSYGGALELSIEIMFSMRLRTS